MINNSIDLSFVIPCLNEEETLPLVLKTINDTIENSFTGIQTEIIVSDNGSTDNSVKIAEEYGAKVFHCDERGYGAALINGFMNARGKYLIYADADNTYDFSEAPKLYNEIIKGFELVVGSRLDGKIEHKAMPFLHRYLGTPILNFFINSFFANKSNKIADCNSGFRCIKKESFLKWGIKSPGMEFASEMLVKALKNDAIISHVPISLNKDSGNRIPHLKTWRDGMRHLLYIFSEGPNFFYKSGLIFTIISLVVLIIGALFGPIKIALFSIFGIHTMLLMLLMGVFGITLFGIGLGLSVKLNEKIYLYQKIINLSEDKLFWYSLIISVLSLSFFIGLFIYWGLNNFSNIDLSKETLLIISLGIFGIQFVSIVISGHLIKRV